MLVRSAGSSMDGGGVLRREEIPTGELARSMWAALPKTVRRQVMKDADQGRAFGDPKVASVAVGLAWEILGLPESRRRIRVWGLIGFLIEAIVSSAPGINLKLDVFDGKTEHDANPVVRGMAKRIEAANPVGPSVAAA